MAKSRKIKPPYDPLNFDEMVTYCKKHPADPQFTMLWDLARKDCEDTSDEDGHGNPMPKSGLKPGAKLPRFLKKP